MPAGPLEAPVLAVDLDGTLLGINTFPAFVRFTVRRLVAQREVLVLGRLVGALLRRKLLRGRHVHFKAAVHRAGGRLEPVAVASWAAGVVAEHTHQAVAEMVRSWRGDTVLVTAAPSVYADVIARSFPFTDVHASEFVGRDYVENIHAAKAERLRGVLAGALDAAVTDDVDIDGPLLDLATLRYVVDASGTVRSLAG